jgi:hypothetical protein
MRHRWIRILVAGVAAGFIILGVGGRVAMRFIALDIGQTPSFKLSGTFTVILMGGLSGLAGGAFYAVADRLLPVRIWARSVLRSILFWTFLVLITLRGLHPVEPYRLVLFLPLVAMFGAVVEFVARRPATDAVSKLVELPNAGA